MICHHEDEYLNRSCMKWQVSRKKKQVCNKSINVDRNLTFMVQPCDSSHNHKQVDAQEQKSLDSREMKSVPILCGLHLNLLSFCPFASESNCFQSSWIPPQT